MEKFYYTIGLEVHAELSTKTKMFCSCKNDPDEQKPNRNICPVCSAQPGTLPVPNEEAIKNVIKVGLAIGGNIADFTEFDRKNYFYPDIPKGYQISQYKYPIVSGGHLSGFDITRIHLEEDTGTSKHGDEKTLVDLNRAGVPLMELVTEPHTFDDKDEAIRVAGKFARDLQLLLWYLGVSEANMEKGEMRVEANISITSSKKLELEGLNQSEGLIGRTDLDKFQSVLGTKVEVKNLNSFKSMERAVLYEFDRMEELHTMLRDGEIRQETRGWDENKGKTFSQRSKENASDYRYFPEPDIPKFKLHTLFDIKEIEKNLPELPEEKRNRYRNEFGIKDEDIESYINNLSLGEFFEKVIADFDSDKELIKTASNFITSDLVGTLAKDTEAKIPNDKSFASLIKMFKDGSLSSRSTKDILIEMTKSDLDPAIFAEEKGLIQKNDPEALKAIVEKVISENQDVVETYKGGKENALMSLVGKVMKETAGSANPALVQELLKELI
ncbi:Asp-tRNA(Asn)/Glu-tRNA(Gln) amidotransferase subunit GatB [Candidatus Nomurabacteria bacterium]|nr:Asp-tRNA(Asn)/Glu-tRNA(Gln) amidotransferase subunit GatB [Candidatus Nomurabacteria bacterium]